LELTSHFPLSEIIIFCNPTDLAPSRTLCRPTYSENGHGVTNRLDHHQALHIYNLRAGGFVELEDDPVRPKHVAPFNIKVVKKFVNTVV
jgi:hypothetical protein